MAVAVPVEGAEFSVKLDSHIRDSEREAAGRKRMGVLRGGLGSYDVQQSVSVQLPICMAAVWLIKESFPFCKKRKKRGDHICSEEDLHVHCRPVLLFSTGSDCEGKKKFPFLLFFKRAFVASRLPLSFFARRLLLFHSLILMATADCGASLCRTTSANGPKHHPGTSARRC